MSRIDFPRMLSEDELAELQGFGSAAQTRRTTRDVLAPVDEGRVLYETPRLPGYTVPFGDTPKRRA